MTPSTVKILLGVLLICSVAGSSNFGGDSSIIGGTPGEFDIDCDRGDTITKAVGLSGPEPTVIRIRGICSEDVLIDRDDITLTGASPNATIAGALSDPGQPTVRVEGARNIVLSDLRIVAPDSRGFVTSGSSTVTLERVRVLGASSGTGVLVQQNSLVQVEDCGFDYNFFGMFVSGNSTVRFSGTNTASFNIAGVIFGDNSLGTVGGVNTSLETSDNEIAGIVVQEDAFAQFRTLIAHRNGDSGVWLVGGGATIGHAELYDNGYFGIWLKNGKLDLGTGLTSGGFAGIYSEFDSTVELARGSSSRVEAEEIHLIDSSVWMGHTAVARLFLAFGTRVNFLLGNAIGSVACDDTVITAGTLSCPADVTATAEPTEFIPFSRLESIRLPLREPDPERALRPIENAVGCRRLSSAGACRLR